MLPPAFKMTQDFSKWLTIKPKVVAPQSFRESSPQKNRVQCRCSKKKPKASQLKVVIIVWRRKLSVFPDRKLSPSRGFIRYASFKGKRWPKVGSFYSLSQNQDSKSGPRIVTVKLSTTKFVIRSTRVTKSRKGSHQCLSPRIRPSFSANQAQGCGQVFKQQSAQGRGCKRRKKRPKVAASGFFNQVSPTTRVQLPKKSGEFNFFFQNPKGRKFRETATRTTKKNVEV